MVDVKAAIEPDQRVVTRFWASHPEMVDRIKQRETELQQRLSRQGLTLDALNVAQGAAPHTANPISHRRLVDIHS